jgi:hypothetical protein
MEPSDKIKGVIADIMQQSAQEKQLSENFKIPTVLRSSEEAEDFVDTLHSMIGSKALMDYAKKTDRNFPTNMESQLKLLQAQWKKFMFEWTKSAE